MTRRRTVGAASARRRSDGPGPLRIALVTPPMERVPPVRYGGTERIVAELADELHRRGHDLTVFASGDSQVPGRLAPIVPQALRPAGFDGDPSPYFLAVLLDVLRREGEFDLIHSHLEWTSLVLARAATTPVVSTFHGRLDLPVAKMLLADRPAGLVAISDSQRRVHPDIAFEVVHNGLTFPDRAVERRRSDALCVVGRVAPEKGIVEAIDVARRTGRPLRVAAKIGPLPDEQAYWNEVVKPAIESADVEFLGELDATERDRLFGESYATLMVGSWPEPFGLVAIESLACGTPVIARRVGALPEIIRDGVDGFFGDDAAQHAFLLDRVGELDRVDIAASVRDRFSARRMADGYEAVYARRLGLAGSDADTLPDPTAADPEVVRPLPGVTLAETAS